MKRERIRENQPAPRSSLEDDLDEADLVLLEQLEEAIKIDQDELDEALIQQPSLFYEVSRHLTILLSRRDEAKSNLQAAEARADIGIRRKAREKEEKKNEAEIAAEKRLSTDVAKADRAHQRLVQTCGHFEALKQAFQQRGFVLKSLADLYVSNYFTQSSGGKERSGIKEERAGQNKQNMARMRRGLDD